MAEPYNHSNESPRLGLGIVEKVELELIVVRPGTRARFNSGIAMIAALLALAATPVYADIGVPMVLAIWPASWALLLLVIPLEAAVGVRILGQRFRSCVRMAGAANLVSTLVGIPITWALLVLVQLLTDRGAAWGLGTPWHRVAAVTLQSAWLIPYEGDLDWMIPAAGAFLCVPFFFMSVGCEYLVARQFVEKTQRRELKRWAWQANALSYGLLLLILGTKLLIALRDRGMV